MKFTQSLKAAVTSWRVGAVTLLSLPSGLPLGLVLTSLPAWLAAQGVDIKTIGVVTLAQAPYAFKFVWAPLLDRFRFPVMGRRRGWILVFQLALAACLYGFASMATNPQVAAAAALMFLLAFAASSQDIVIDAYAVDALKKEEQGIAVGARNAMYRTGMWLSGYIAVSVAPVMGWSLVFITLGTLFVATTVVSMTAPEPAVDLTPPRTLREAVWEPFVGFFQKPRALEITAFLVLYKFADNLAAALVTPFLVQTGFDMADTGVVRGTISLLGVSVGTFLGGMLTVPLGVGRALWVFGVLQAVSNVGYALVASVGPVAWVMYLAVAIETSTTGLGNGAFGVLLFRLTEKRFSATQFALFSSIFALGRTLSGPPAGVLVDALGWRDFFYLTVFSALPGMIMLQRFVPWGQREIPEAKDGEVVLRPMSNSALALRGVLWTIAGALFALAGSACLSALKQARGGKMFDPLTPLLAYAHPQTSGDWIELVSLSLFGLVTGVGAAAYLAARRTAR